MDSVGHGTLSTYLTNRLRIAPEVRTDPEDREKFPASEARAIRARRWTGACRAPNLPVMSDTDGRRWHDMGGQKAGPISTEEHDYALWEKRVDALMVLCGGKGLFTVDGLRRALEDMGEDAFEKYTYYERWIAAVNQNLVEAGVYSLEELSHRMNEIEKRGATYGEAQNG